MIQCQACGTENPPDAAFCSKCARKLDAATQQAVAEQRAAHTETGIRWSSVLITVIVILILAVLVTLLIAHVT